ncbi:MAG: pyruvate, water dikinase regulatory protein [Oscillospiraceae bacterium]
MIVYVLSDSIGETGTTLVRSVISQFSVSNLEIKRFPFINNTQTIQYHIEKLSRELDKQKLIVYTLINPELCRFVEEYAKRSKIPAMDALTPYINQIKTSFNIEPCMKPGVSHLMDMSYNKRVEAIEFATKYDDGKDNSGIFEADIVLIGISRTSKTPICMYLAYQSIKAANIPLVMDVDPPEAIFDLPRFKVIGLTIQPDVLQTIRQNRLREIGVSSDANYATMDRILKEAEYAERLMKKIGCPIIDVSNKAIEETSGKIMEIIQKSNFLR